MQSLEPAITPRGKQTFLLDWEITMRCNLSCSYCGNKLYGGRLDGSRHPPLEECLQTIDFMYEYVDLYIQQKASWGKSVVMNVYGGESLFHPDIEEIHKAIKDRHQGYDWELIVTTTTNLIIGKNLLSRIIPNIDEFTTSYHSESTDKQKQIFRDNLLTIKESGKRLKFIVMMNPLHWDDALSIIEFCKDNGIKCLPRQIDEPSDKPTADKNFLYNAGQVEWFNNLYNTLSYGNTTTIKTTDDINSLSDIGRACCGGRQVCSNQNYKKREFYVQNNNFNGWKCSVNWFFLYIKQLNGEVFTNKDCKMAFDGSVNPIGNLSDTKSMIDYLKTHLENNTLPTITCAKKQCFCGLCAPKAVDQETYDTIIKKYLKPTS